jgi:hypothetical protein
MADSGSERTGLLNHAQLFASATLILLGASWLFSQQSPGGGSKLVLARPPGASTRMHMPDLFPEAMKLGDVARKVSNALNQAGYTDQGWFVVRSTWPTIPASPTAPPPVIGFAVVTRLEQIDDEGAGKSGRSRWALDLSSPGVGSFLDAVKLLLKGAPNGKYRVFLIWVSNDPVSQAQTSPTEDIWQNYLRDGTKAPWLSVMDAIPLNYGGGGGCSVFVYEYERSAVSGEAQFVTSSALTAEQHLKASGIWDAWAREGKNK